MGNNPKLQPGHRVVENRLVDDKDTHGVIGMDSTTLYGARQGSGANQLTSITDNPYNTRHAGLHPPINQPSADAIKAVPNPEAAGRSTSTQVRLCFAATADEHRKNKAKLDAYCTKRDSVLAAVMMMWAAVIGSPIAHSLSPVIHRA